MKVLGLSGSLRADSTNTRLLQAAASLCPAQMDFHVEDVLGELPHFSPDLSIESDPQLLEFVQRVRESDGIMISSPVYAGGYPGTLKNALDWLVGTDAFVEKPFMMLSASNRVPAVQASLVTVLETMSGIHLEKASALVPLLGTSMSTQEIAVNREFAGLIQSAIRTFTDQIAQRTGD